MKRQEEGGRDEEEGCWFRRFRLRGLFVCLGARLDARARSEGQLRRVRTICMLTHLSLPSSLPPLLHTHRRVLTAKDPVAPKNIIRSLPCASPLMFCVLCVIQQSSPTDPSISISPSLPPPFVAAFPFCSQVQLQGPNLQARGERRAVRTPLRPRRYVCKIASERATGGMRGREGQGEICRHADTREHNTRTGGKRHMGRHLVDQLSCSACS